MNNGFLYDQGCGPQFIGRRITVFDLVPYFLEDDTTEALICKIYDLSPEQVAAARAYVLHHFDEVMAQHRRIEARNAAGNPPEVTEQMKRTHEAFEAYRRQFMERKRADAVRQGKPEELPMDGGTRLTFREWIEQRHASGAEA